MSIIDIVSISLKRSLKTATQKIKNRTKKITKRGSEWGPGCRKVLFSLDRYFGRKSAVLQYKFPKTNVRDALKELQARGLVWCDKTGSKWKLTIKGEIIKTIEILKEKMRVIYRNWNSC